MFTENFDRYVIDGEKIHCEIDGIRFTATVYRDDHSDTPDEHDDGFWPSLDPDSAGYIGAKSKATLRRHMARAKAVKAAWCNDEWWYCGIAVTAHTDGAQLVGDFEVALWGIECNYPTFRHSDRPNAYLREVANHLLPEAQHVAKEKLASIVKHANAHA